MPIIEAFAVPHPPILIPGVGRGEQHGAQPTLDSYQAVARRIAELSPDLIILTTSHGDLYRDAISITTGNACWGDFADFRDPVTRLQAALDEKFVDCLIDQIETVEKSGSLPFVAVPEPHNKLDHGCLVPLYFISRHCDLSSCKIARLGISFLDDDTHFRMGRAVAAAVDALGRRAVFVASGDLSHRLKQDGPYGFNPTEPKFDAAVCKAFAAGDFKALRGFEASFREEAAECGLSSFIMLAGALDGIDVEAELLSYEGPWGVGYAVARFGLAAATVASAAATVASPAKQAAGVAAVSSQPALPVRLAFATLDDWLAGVGAPGESSPGVLQLCAEIEGGTRQAAAGGAAGGAAAGGGGGLQGAEGAEAAADGGGLRSAENATTAALSSPTTPAAPPSDARLLAKLRNTKAGVFVSFHKGDELRGCIGTLSPSCKNVVAEICQNTVSAAAKDPRFAPIRPSEREALACSVDVLSDSEPVADIEQLDAARYGVIVSAGYRRGVLLPNLEGVDTPAEQIAIALRKAGIRPDETYFIERFEVVRYE